MSTSDIEGLHATRPLSPYLFYLDRHPCGCARGEHPPLASLHHHVVFDAGGGKEGGEREEKKRERRGPLIRLEHPPLISHLLVADCRALKGRKKKGWREKEDGYRPARSPIFIHHSLGC